MEFSWSKEDKEVRARAQEFTEKALFPYELHIEETDTPDPKVEAGIVQALNDYALNAANQPVEYGGQAMSVVQQCILWEEAGKATNALWGRVWMPPICLQAGTPEQIEKYLVPSCSGAILSAFCTSEPDAGSDAGALKTWAVADGDDYVINGEKSFASNAEFADFMLLTTFIDGDPSKATIFLVDKDTPGVKARCLPHFSARTGWGHPELDIVDPAGSSFAYSWGDRTRFRVNKGLVCRGAVGLCRAVCRGGHTGHGACVGFCVRAQAVRIAHRGFSGHRVHACRHGHRYHGRQVNAVSARSRNRRWSGPQIGAPQERAPSSSSQRRWRSECWTRRNRFSEDVG